MITFDRAGRLFSAFLDRRYYRRGLDGRIVERLAGQQLIQRQLEPDEARGVVERALRLAGDVPRPASLGIISDLAADASRFRAAYDGAVAPLPPDINRALVLQATVGCAYNACLYCTKYKDTEFRARDDEDFARHVDAVTQAFGEGISLRRGVFLGDADALFLDTERLERFCALAMELEPAHRFA